MNNVLATIRSGQVEWTRLGTPCTTFCRFYVMFAKNCSRSSANPAGSGVPVREAEGNLLLDDSCRIIRLAMKLGTWWSLENPRASLLWVMSSIKQLLNRRNVSSAFLVYCEFKSPYQKRTRFAGS